MFIVKHDQIEAFRIPMREAARDKLIADLADDNVQVSSDKKTLVYTDEAGSDTTLLYSADVLPSTILKPSGTRYQMGYDNEGCLSRLTYPDGNKLSFKFDKGQLLQLGSSPDKSYRFVYQKGQLTRVVYPGQKSQQFLYNDFGNLTGIVDRTGQTHRFIRTPNGQLKAIKDPLNRSVQFLYDEHGLLSDLVFPDGTRQSYLYDEEADLLTLQLRDGKQFYQRYYGGLIDQLSWQDGPTVLFSYNQQNQPTLIQTESTGVSYAYDENGRLIRESNPFGHTAFGYDNASRLTKLTLPTGLVVSYAYDSESRVVGLQLGGDTILFVYEQDLLTEVRYPGGITEYQQRSHTEGLKHVRVQNLKGEVLSEQQYTYDNWDRLSRYQDTIHRQNIKLSYDDESRLTTLTDAQTRRPIERYEYDAKGNLTALNGYPVVVGVMDEVRQIGRMGVQYDVLGNVTRIGGPKGKLNLSFARNSTLTSVETQAGTWQYTYDGIGRRISKSNGTEKWCFAWAGSQLVTEFYESRPGAAPIIREYIYLPDSQVPIAFREGNELYWMQADIRGAVTYVFNRQGQVVWHGTYSAFGELTAHLSQIRQPWRLMGQYEDEETGLYYNLARYYCPWLTTYLSLDPEWLDPETYYYSYARNDPYNRADPLGNIAPLLGAALIGAAVGGVISGVIKAAEGGSFREVVGAVAHGALSGAGAAVGGIVGLAVGGPLGAYAGMVAGTGTGGFLGSLTEQAINGENIFTKCALQKALGDAGEEMLYAAALGVVGKVLGPVLRPVRHWIAKTKIGQIGLNTLKGSVKQVRRGINKLRKKIGLEPINGTLSDIEAREWYLQQEANIPSQVNKALSIKEQAKQAFELRNRARAKARDLMADREKAKQLDITDPHRTWEEIVKKYEDKGLSGDELYKEILAASQRSRQSVNKSLGL